MMLKPRSVRRMGNSVIQLITLIPAEAVSLERFEMSHWLDSSKQNLIEHLTYERESVPGLNHYTSLPTILNGTSCMIQHPQLGSIQTDY